MVKREELVMLSTSPEKQECLNGAVPCDNTFSYHPYIKLGRQITVLPGTL